MTDSPQTDYAATITIRRGNLLVEDVQPKQPIIDGYTSDLLFVMPQTRRRLFEVPRDQLDAHAFEAARAYLNQRVRIIVAHPHASCIGWLTAFEECADAPAVRLTIVEPQDIDEKPPLDADVYVGDPATDGWRHVGRATDIRIEP